MADRYKNTKTIGKRKQPDTAEEVEKKCRNGEVKDEHAHGKIKKAVDAILKKHESAPSGIKCDVISFSKDTKLGRKIIKLLREAIPIPKGAKVLDFESNQKSKDGSLGPWIAQCKETDLHNDIQYNQDVTNSQGRKLITLVYIVDKKEEESPILYKIYGRKKNVKPIEEKPHVMEVNRQGQWVSFPSTHYHLGSGARRTIISLILSIDEDSTTLIH